MNRIQHQAIDTNYYRLLDILKALELLYRQARDAGLAELDKAKYEEYKEYINKAASDVNGAIKQIVLIEVENS